MPKSNQHACAVYDFRLSEGTTTPDHLKVALAKIAKRFTFQLEVGDGGYRHYQGRLSLIKKRRVTEIRKPALWVGVPVPQYLQPSVSGTRNEDFYVSKEDTRVAGPWTDSTQELEGKTWMPLHAMGLDTHLRPFQLQMLESAVRPDLRVVNYIYDKKGDVGKTLFRDWMYGSGRGFYLPSFNNYQAILQAACSLWYGKTRDPGLVIIDMPKALAKDNLRELYAAIESVKDGLLMDLRYKARVWQINRPAVWVFSNTYPDLTLLSRDRWRIWRVNRENWKFYPAPNPRLDTHAAGLDFVQGMAITACECKCHLRYTSPIIDSVYPPGESPDEPTPVVLDDKGKEEESPPRTEPSNQTPYIEDMTIALTVSDEPPGRPNNLAVVDDDDPLAEYYTD